MAEPPPPPESTRGPSLRARLTLLVAAAVAIGAGVAALIAGVVATSRVRAGLDTELEVQAASIAAVVDDRPGSVGRPGPGGEPAVPGRPGERPRPLPAGFLAERFGRRAAEVIAEVEAATGRDRVVAVVAADGTVVIGGALDGALDGATDGAADGAAAAASGVGARAAATRSPVIATVSVAGERWRVVAVPAGGNLAVQVAGPTAPVDATVRRVSVALVLGWLAVGVVAPVVAWPLTGAALAPLRRLSRAATQVRTTRDLTTPVPVDGPREVAELGRTVADMLGSLALAEAEQRRLVADASHELRTPLTSMRTNVEVLAGYGDRMDAAERARLLADLTAQAEELTVLVADLTELAAGAPGADPAARPAVEVAVDAVVVRAVERARRRADGAVVTVSTEPVTVRGSAALLERAVVNLVDNALRWGAAPVRVTLTRTVGADGAAWAELEVLDAGPGIATTDLPHVFDRFYRAVANRAAPGSGLGLAIVRDAATRHGGTAGIGPAPGGGTRVVVRLPALADRDDQRQAVEEP
jgi:two-component system sensor histidine kinase MprB